MNWEKEVLPLDDNTLPRTSPSSQLESIGTGKVAKAWEPLTDATLAQMVEGSLQEYVVYPPPLWIMSPRTRVYLAKDITRFKGYLSKFEPCMSAEGEVEIAVTITVSGGES